MVKIYRIMLDDEWINDVHYDKHVALVHAKYFAEDTGETVEIWESEEHKFVFIPYDLMTWTLNRKISNTRR